MAIGRLDLPRGDQSLPAGDLEKRPFVLVISGMLDRPEGPLTLHVPGKDGKSQEISLDHRNFDKELFKIERKDNVTTVEFLAKGKQLIKAGVMFQYIDFFR